MAEVQIGDRLIGTGHPTFFVAEIGINHNGELETAKELIESAVAAGCDAVKFQKRNPDQSVPGSQRDVMRETPWGVMSYIDYRRRIELSESDFASIDSFCKERGILWFASCWDVDSLELISGFGPPCYKIASAGLTGDELLKAHREKGYPLIMSTGMSTLDQIDHAVEVLGGEELILLHTVSTYPARLKDLNLKMITSLRERYQVPVGYSGHEVGLYTTLAAVVLGANVVERHITLDRSMWGTDQAASVEPQGLARLVRDIRAVELALGDGVKRIYEGEIPVMKKLRGEA